MSDQKPTDLSASDPDRPTPPAPGADGLERRQFVRRMGTDAARIAGSLFNLSRVITRSATAAGQAMVNELDGARPMASIEPVPEPVPEVLPSPATWGVTAPAASPARPTLALDADQLALLEAATSAVVAVNREGYPPQLTTATVLWDGVSLRFATLGWSRRTAMLRADPRIGLLIDGPDGAFVSVTGTARIADGREARDAIWPLLLREAGDAGEAEAVAEARWQQLLATDPDRAAIVIEPDQVLSGRR